MMKLDLIQQRLNEYNCTSPAEEDYALREILQEFILLALARTDYFTKAAFHGGTHLRVFHGLQRFSEDLDFALKEDDPSFEFKPYLDKVRKELEAVGVMAEVVDRSKAGQTIKKAFLKDNSIIRLVELKFAENIGSLQTPRKLRIKMEVDSHPPAGAEYESQALSFPFPASVTNFDLPSSFAGKMHALLCREYVKGRDWYDFIWYVGRKVKLNHRFLSAALDQQGRWAGRHVETSDAWVKEELKKVIAALDFEAAKEDVANFVYAGELGHLDYFNREFFAAMAEKL